MNKAILAYVIGIAIGDGNLSNPNGRALRLRIFCDLKYPRLLQRIQHAVQHVCPNNKVSIRKISNTYAHVSCYSNTWKDLLNWSYTNGPKTNQSIRIPDWILESKRLTRNCIRGLIETDGSAYHDRNYLMVNFVTTIPSLADSFFTAVKRFGYAPKLYIHKGPNLDKYTIRVARNAESFIKEFKIRKD